MWLEEDLKSAMLWSIYDLFNMTIKTVSDGKTTKKNLFLNDTVNQEFQSVFMYHVIRGEA